MCLSCLNKSRAVHLSCCFVRCIANACCSAALAGNERGGVGLNQRSFEAQMSDAPNTITFSKTAIKENEHTYLHICHIFIQHLRQQQTKFRDWVPLGEKNNHINFKTPIKSHFWLTGMFAQTLPAGFASCAVLPQAILRLQHFSCTNARIHALMRAVLLLLSTQSVHIQYPGMAVRGTFSALCSVLTETSHCF